MPLGQTVIMVSQLLHEEPKTPAQEPPLPQPPHKDPPPGELPRRDPEPKPTPDEPLPGIIDPLPPDSTPSEPVIG